MGEVTLENGSFYKFVCVRVCEEVGGGRRHFKETHLNGGEGKARDFLFRKNVFSIP